MPRSAPAHVPLDGGRAACTGRPARAYEALHGRGVRCAPRQPSPHRSLHGRGGGGKELVDRHARAAAATNAHTNDAPDGGAVQESNAAAASAAVATTAASTTSTATTSAATGRAPRAPRPRRLARCAGRLLRLLRLPPAAAPTREEPEGVGCQDALSASPPGSRLQRLDRLPLIPLPPLLILDLEPPDALSAQPRLSLLHALHPIRLAPLPLLLPPPLGLRLALAIAPLPVSLEPELALEGKEGSLGGGKGEAAKAEDLRHREGVALEGNEPQLHLLGQRRPAHVREQLLLVGGDVFAPPPQEAGVHPHNGERSLLFECGSRGELPPLTRRLQRRGGRPA